MEKPDPLTEWAKNAEWNVARCLASYAVLVGKNAGQAAPLVGRVTGDLVDSLLKARDNVNFLLLLLSKCQKGEE